MAAPDFGQNLLGNLDEPLGPAGEHGRIRGRECRAGIECQEKIVHKAGRPAWVDRFLRRWSEGHLGKEEISFGMVAAKIARMRSSRVQPPIPRGEDQNVGHPEGSSRAQQTRWRQLVPGKGADEEKERPKHCRSGDAQHDIPENLVEGKGAAEPGDHHRDHEHGNHHQQKPGWTKGQRFRQGQMQATHPQNGDNCRPRRFGFSQWFGRGLGHVRAAEAGSGTEIMENVLSTAYPFPFLRSLCRRRKGCLRPRQQTLTCLFAI